MTEPRITKKELLIIASVTFFAVIWIVFAVTAFMRWNWFAAQAPPVQLILYDSGYLLLFIAIIGVPLTTYLLKPKKGRLIMAAKIGVGLWLGDFAIDLLKSPYYVGPSGNVLLNNPEAMTGSSVDATIAWCWMQLGLGGPALFYCIYVVTPIIMVTGVVFMFTYKRVLKIVFGKV